MIVLSKEKASAALAAILVSVCLCGCAGDVEWSDTFPKTAVQVVGFVDDSLVIVYDYQRWRRNLGSFIQDHGEESGVGHQRLLIFNYRIQEDGPRWADTLDNADVEDFNYVRGQLSDSVVWGGDPKATVSFWKIGEKPHKMKIKKVLDDCNVYFRVEKLRNWLDGMIYAGENLMVSGDTCQYAILDTATRTLTYKRLDKDLEWIKSCEDVRGWWGNVYCLRKNIDKSGFFLIVNNEKKDSILIEDVPNTSNLWNYFEFCFMGNMIYFGHNVNLINFKYERIIIHPNIKATSGLNYIDENNNNVNYEFYWE